MAMKNSTEQLLRTKSLHLQSISCPKDSYVQPIDVKNFNKFDANNLYKTSYSKMTFNDLKPFNKTYLPHYGGFIPGMNSENPFGSSFTKLASMQINKFENRNEISKEQQNSARFHPISKFIGSFWNSKKKVQDFQTQYQNLPYTTDLRQSGYSINLLAKAPAGNIVPGLGGNMTSTEYRVNFNKRRDFQYRGPTFNSGILKKSNDKEMLLK